MASLRATDGAARSIGRRAVHWLRWSAIAIASFAVGTVAGQRLPRSGVVAAPAASRTLPGSDSDQSVGPAGPEITRIQGRVTANEGRSVRHANVSLLGTNGRQIETSITDDLGRYSFERVTRGVYRISATKAGFVTLEYGQATPFGPSRTVKVDKRPLTGVDLELREAGLITGRVWDEIGDAVSDAQVSALRYEYVAGRPRLVAVSHRSTKTDESGKFSIFGLPPGDYYLRALAGGAFRNYERNAAPTAFLPTFFPGTASVTAGQLVHVDSGRDSVAGFPLVLSRLLRLTGCVTDSSNKRVTTGFVRLAEVGDPTNGKVVPVAADGCFDIQFAGPSGHYSLTAVRNTLTSGMQRDSEVGRLSLVLGGNDVSGLVIRTKPGAILSGSVITDPPSAAPAPLRVFSASLDADDTWPAALSVPISPDGSFQIRNLFWPSVVLTDLAEDSPWAVHGIYRHGVDITTSGIEPKSADRIDAVTIVLTPRKTTLSGSVLRVDATNCTGCAVLMFAEDPRLWTDRL